MPHLRLMEHKKLKNEVKTSTCYSQAPLIY